MPAYNAEKYVCEAMDSVFQQAYQPLEFIIINDGSTDDTEATIEQYINQHPLSDHIQFHKQINNGVAATLNRGVSLARGQYIAFIDADDIWEPNKLSKQMAVIKKQPDLDMVFGHAQQFYSPELTKAERGKMRCPTSKEPATLQTAMLIKASSLQKLDGFNERWRKGHFLDWFSRAREKGLKYVTLPDVVYRRRLHTSNMGIYMRDNYVDYVRILKASLDRRRSKST